MAADRWLSVARQAGLTRRDLERYAALELIDLAEELEEQRAEVEARLRRIRRLHRHMDLPLEAVDVILRLRARLDAEASGATAARITVRVVEDA
jgi:hypothetical protein